MKPNFKVISLTSLLMLGLVGCGGGSGSTTPSSITDTIYQGQDSSGNNVSVTVGSTQFQVVDHANSVTMSGDKSTLANGFLKLVTTSSTSPSVTVPNTHYALEYPQTALIAGGNNMYFVGFTIGSCVNSTNDYNYAVMPLPGTTITTDTSIMWGTANVSANGATSEFSATATQSALDGTDLTATPAPAPDTGLCSDGAVTLASGSELLISQTGMIFGKNPGGDDFVGMLKPASNIDTSNAVGALTEAGNIINFVLFKPDQQGVMQLRPARIEATGNGVFTAYDYSDFENNIVNTTTGTITITGQSSPGVLQGTALNGDGSTNEIQLMVSNINGKYVLFGFSWLAPIAPSTTIFDGTMAFGIQQ
ncbi:MAG: hypothetical protein OEY09_03115 [Gammaproteobacteria bacterium]|nr:hypothetical protein [Gammaproteobacteria bacterium]